MFTVKIISQDGMVNLHSFSGVTFVDAQSDSFWSYAESYGLDRITEPDDENNGVLNTFAFLVDRDSGLEGMIPLEIGDKVYVTDMSGKTVLSEETMPITKEDKESAED